jgi:hypothetical protein
MELTVPVEGGHLWADDTGGDGARPGPDRRARRQAGGLGITSELSGTDGGASHRARDSVPGSSGRRSARATNEIA